MKLTNRRKCEVCEAPVTLFPETINMFDGNANPLSGKLLDEIKAWRQQRVYCEEHQSMKEQPASNPHHGRQEER